MNGPKRGVVIGLALLVLCGCASTPVAAPPQIVTVTKVQYVPMPAVDLLPCTVATQRIVTGADVIDAWQRTLQALAVCNAQVSDLRNLNPSSQAAPEKP
jgi:hypothetical protein